MTPLYIHCRKYPGDVNCLLALRRIKKLLAAVIQHVTTVNGYEDTSEFRKKIAVDFKKGPPPL